MGKGKPRREVCLLFGRFCFLHTQAQSTCPGRVYRIWAPLNFQLSGLISCHHLNVLLMTKPSQVHCPSSNLTASLFILQQPSCPGSETLLSVPPSCSPNFTTSNPWLQPTAQSLLLAHYNSAPPALLSHPFIFQVSALLCESHLLLATSLGNMSTLLCSLVNCFTDNTRRCSFNACLTSTWMNECDTDTTNNYLLSTWQWPKLSHRPMLTVNGV